MGPSFIASTSLSEVSVQTSEKVQRTKSINFDLQHFHPAEIYLHLRER